VTGIASYFVLNCRQGFLIDCIEFQYFLCAVLYSSYCFVRFCVAWLFMCFLSLSACWKVRWVSVYWIRDIVSQRWLNITANRALLWEPQISKQKSLAPVVHAVGHLIIIIISNLSNDRSKASSKMIPPHSVI